MLHLNLHVKINLNIYIMIWLYVQYNIFYCHTANSIKDDFPISDVKLLLQNNDNNNNNNNNNNHENNDNNKNVIQNNHYVYANYTETIKRYDDKYRNDIAKRKEKMEIKEKWKKKPRLILDNKMKEQINNKFWQSRKQHKMKSAYVNNFNITKMKKKKNKKKKKNDNDNNNNNNNNYIKRNELIESDIEQQPKIYAQYYKNHQNNDHSHNHYPKNQRIKFKAYYTMNPVPIAPITITDLNKPKINSIINYDIYRENHRNQTLHSGNIRYLKENEQKWWKMLALPPLNDRKHHDREIESKRIKIVQKQKRKLRQHLQQQQHSQQQKQEHLMDNYINTSYHKAPSLSSSVLQALSLSQLVKPENHNNKRFEDNLDKLKFAEAIITNKILNVYYDEDENFMYHRKYNDNNQQPEYQADATLTIIPNNSNSMTMATKMSIMVTTTTNNNAQIHWPIKREAIVEGDVILGGLMMVHSREDTIICGPIMPQGGIQALEAMLYTIDYVNRIKLLPNITLGAHILDDCDKDSYGLEMAVDFIKGSISNIDDAEYYCNKTQVPKVISGVVGAASSVTSIQVANLLRLFRIPQVSFFSTSPELSNKQRFEYFSRTIPSDHYQVKAMVDIVKRLNWSYISIIYEESNYGIKAFEELEELLSRHNVCIAVKEKLVKDSGVAKEIVYDNIVQKLLTKPHARGAIIFGSDQEVREVMRAVRRNNATGAFSWIGSDGWSARNLVSDGNEPEVEGTLSVQPQANPVKGFEEYFLNLTVENNQRNPWFVEFWEDHFQCRYPSSSSTPHNNYNQTCTTKERLTRNNTDFEDQLQFVSDAVLAFAYALKDMHHDLCFDRPTLCDAMKPTRGADLLKYLRKVEFYGLSGDYFRFDANGDGPARYNIIHFKQSIHGQYHWIKVGEYYEGELRLNMSEIQFKLLEPKPPESVCSLPCERGQAKKYVEGESCCWHCFNCSTYQIRHPQDETQCLTCQLGTLPDIYKQYCQHIPEIYLRPGSGWAIGAMSFSSIGIIITLFIISIFVRHNETPIVKASGRELSYILLAGILMCYGVTFALVLRPTNVVCAVQRFSVGFCFTVVYAALLTKTNRIARIFKAGKQSAKRPSCISPKSQLFICSCLIFIQILINGVWMVIAPSHAIYHHPTREDNLLVCDSYIDTSYMIAFFYPIVLIIICTIYAVLTRKIPEAFNESKYIGFTMYTTCVIWLAFVPLYFGTANDVPLRITSMSVTISLSASVTVACLFSPKLYIILIRPERNVRQSMMLPRYSAIQRSFIDTRQNVGIDLATTTAAAAKASAAAASTANIYAKDDKMDSKKELCEMATQTITLTTALTNIDVSTCQHIPYVDQNNTMENSYYNYKHYADDNDNDGANDDDDDDDDDDNDNNVIAQNEYVGESRIFDAKLEKQKNTWNNAMTNVDTSNITASITNANEITERATDSNDKYPKLHNEYRETNIFLTTTSL